MTSSPAELSSHPLEVCLDDALLEISAMELLRSRLEYQATILRMQVDASPGSSNSPQDPLRVNVESWVSEVLDWMQVRLESLRERLGFNCLGNHPETDPECAICCCIMIMMNSSRLMLSKLQRIVVC